MTSWYNVGQAITFFPGPLSVIQQRLNQLLLPPGYLIDIRIEVDDEAIPTMRDGVH